MKTTLSRAASLALFSSFVCAVAFGANAPTNLSATPVSPTQVTLQWTDNSSDEIGFTFMFDTSSGFANASYVWTGGANVTSYAHTGCTAATTYYYRIKAEGSSDALDSPFGNTAAATTPPAGLTATVVSSSQVNLSWTGNGANGSIYGYTVVTNTSASFTGATYHFVSGAGTTTLSRTGLAAGTTYYFAVKAEGNADVHDSPFTPFASATTAQADITPHFFGVNAWMPHQIGAHVFGGKLGTQWDNIQASGAKIMRYGGNGADEHADPLWASGTDSTLKQYLALVDTMRARGIEPVLQVSVYGSRYNAAGAADVVRYVNVTHGRNVKYWSIGNEPDLDSGVYTKTAESIAGYIRAFSSAMKAVDPSIKVLGPETTWYNPAIMEALTTPNAATDITGRDANGRFYVDILTFHHYNGFNGTQDRPSVIAALMQPGGFNDNLAALKARIVACNNAHNRTGASALRMAVTEANVNYWNLAGAGDGVTGNGARSFLGGQWWAELLGVSMRHGVDFVTFWSTIEGSYDYGNELGFISGDGTVKRPSYYHFQMLAQNFRGKVAPAADNQPLVKAFASKDATQTAVVILNQESTASFTYTVRLNTASIGGTSALKINVDASLPMESSGTITPQSTLLLVFDASGVLRKKIDYRIGHASSNVPPVVTTY